MSFGISIYFGLDNTFDENIKLVNKAYELGIKKIFTSMHILESNFIDLKHQYKEFLAKYKSYDLDIITDISPNTFKILDLENMDFESLYKFGIKNIRLDFGYSEKEIAYISNNEYNMKIYLNASTITEEFFKKFDSFNPNYKNIYALHNFYPRMGTGISEEFMIKQNLMLKSKNIKVGAFIQSNNRKRSPLKEGLPTLEVHRDEIVDIAANHLFLLENDFVFIGDSLPSDDELLSMSHVEKDRVMLRVKLYNNDELIRQILNNNYSSRIDEARDCIRTNESRDLLKNILIEPVEYDDNLKYGDITVDNKNYLRYMGELQILKSNKNNDKRINKIAYVIKEDLHLLKYINGGRKFSFKIV